MLIKFEKSQMMPKNNSKFNKLNSKIQFLFLKASRTVIWITYLNASDKLAEVQK